MTRGMKRGGGGSCPDLEALNSGEMAAMAGMAGGAGGAGGGVGGAGGMQASPEIMTMYVRCRGEKKTMQTRVGPFHLSLPTVPTVPTGCA